MSVGLFDLWAPIILGGILAWIASALIHIVIKYHNSDYHELSNEREVAEALGKGSPSPAIYTMPYCTDMKEMGSEEMQKKFNDGPVAMISVFPNGMPPMSKSIIQQIVYFIIGGIFLAYIASLVLPAGAEFMTVFRFVAAVGFLAFGWAVIPFSIWYGHPWGVCARYLLDALIYGAIVAACFAWLWPSIS